MNSFFARASGGQVFLTLTGSFVALMVVMGFIIATNPQLIATAFGRVLLLTAMLVVGGISLRWIWVVVHVCANAELARTRTLLWVFRGALAFIAFDVVLFVIFFVGMSYGQEAFQTFMIVHVGAMLASLLFAVSAGAIIGRGLHGDKAHVGHTIGYVFALSYWPIGIFFIQPGVRRLAGWR